MSGAEDQLAIMNLLARYARGIDRCDSDALESVWWPGATSDYGSGPVDAVKWCGAVLGSIGRYRRTQHFIGNMLIEVDGDRATAETYVRAYHEANGDDGPIAFDVGGRYLDTLEKRGGEWRIATRRYVMDWNRNEPSTAIWDSGIYANLARVGGRKPDDPLYTGR